MSRNRTLQVRVDPDEEARIRLLARDRGIGISEFLRQSALKKKVRGRAVELERVVGGDSPVSGSAASTTRPASAAGVPSGGAGSPPEIVPASSFRCPVQSTDGDYGCQFRAKSPRAVCPTHGRKVVS